MPSEPARERVAASLAEARAIEADWGAAVAALGRGEIDPEPGFLLSTLDGAGEGALPYVALHSAGGSVSAALVGRLVRRRITSRIGYFRVRSPLLDCLDVVYGGCLSDGEPESIRWPAEHLANLLESGRIGCVTLLHLGEDHPSYPTLVRGLVGRRKPIVTPTDHWLATLRDPVTGAIVERHSNRTKRTFRRKNKKLLQHFADDVVVQPVTRLEEVEAFIADAAAIGARGYQGAIGVGVSADSRWNSLIPALARQGFLRGHLLLASGRPIAYALGFVHRGTYTLSATAFDPEFGELSPGEYLLRAVIEELIGMGTATFDFGFGDAAYKRLHGNVCRREALVRFYGNGGSARFSEALERGAGATTRLLRAVLGREGYGRASRAWRKLLRRPK
jgi:hypothetical protein